MTELKFVILSIWQQAGFLRTQLEHCGEILMKLGIMVRLSRLFGRIDLYFEPHFVFFASLSRAVTTEIQRGISAH